MSPLHPSIVIRPTTEGDWPQLRAFRLENAREHPVSYGMSLEEVMTFDDEEWQMQARRGQRDDAKQYVAIETVTGRWVSMMVCTLGDDHGPSAVLRGVYTTEEFRGRAFGIADALLDLIESWAVEHGDTLRLWVNENSEPARRFYRRRGFAVTGRTRPASSSVSPGERLIEMLRSLP